MKPDQDLSTHQLTDFLSKAARQIEKLLSLLGPFQNLSIARREMQIQVQKREHPDTWIRELTYAGESCWNFAQARECVHELTTA
jgi:hypothetical protein